MKTTIITFSIVILSTLFSFSQSIATYYITFTSNWNATDHTSIPSGAHWSKLVGANHNSNVTFYEIGQMMASQGIEDVAERGSNSVINMEINTSITNENTQQYINGSSLGTALGTITISGLEVSEDFPLLTLVSMIAPSPDWFIGVNSLNLRSGNSWRNSITMDLFAIDAGTDSGINYTSSNADNNEPISAFQGMPITAPFNSNKIGTITITLQNVLNVNESELTKIVKLIPNPTQGILEILASDSNPIQKIVVYDILGKQIKKITSKNQISKLDISKFYKGIYIVKLHFEDSSIITRKIVKN